ncbi:MAG: hypothetical protein KAS32_17490 [Candidatus Peribacteraceae bacterium]|nr:hypothetical protein [Candidatus Peribacteraceae bacterium]
MNVRLTEKEYQHMIIELISQSIVNINDISTDDDDIDWIYFIERLKTKGFLSDMRVVTSKTGQKSRRVARDIRELFEKEEKKSITTMI